jgi:uncharacterized protein YoxC
MSLYNGLEFSIMFQRSIHRKLDTIIEKLDALSLKSSQINSREEHIMATIDDLTKDVQDNSDATQSAITLLNNLSTAINQAKNDPAALQALANQLQANSQALAQAVVANTPAQP